MVVSKVFDFVAVRAEVKQHVLGILVFQDVVAIALDRSHDRGGGRRGLGALRAAVDPDPPDRSPHDLARRRDHGRPAARAQGAGRPRARRSRRSSPSGSVSASGCWRSSLDTPVALGSFIAGILVAESGKGHDIGHLTQPLRDVFAAIFFVSVGMTVEPSEAFDNLGASAALSAVIIVVQFISVTVGSVLAGIGLRTAVVSGLALGQIGEFAFIIGGVGVTAGEVPKSFLTVLVTASVLTVFTTPVAMSFRDRIVHAVDTRIPPRILELTSLYAAWLQRFRAAPESASTKKPIIRALRALFFDGAALVLVFAVGVHWASRRGSCALETSGGWLLRGGGARDRRHGAPRGATPRRAHSQRRFCSGEPFPHRSSGSSPSRPRGSPSTL